MKKKGLKTICSLMLVLTMAFWETTISAQAATYVFEGAEVKCTLYTTSTSATATTVWPVAGGTRYVKVGLYYLNPSTNRAAYKVAGPVSSTNTGVSASVSISSPYIKLGAYGLHKVVHNGNTFGWVRTSEGVAP